VPGETLGEHDGGDNWRPQALRAEGPSSGLRRVAGEIRAEAAVAGAPAKAGHRLAGSLAVPPGAGRQVAGHPRALDRPALPHGRGPHPSGPVPSLAIACATVRPARKRRRWHTWPWQPLPPGPRSQTGE
jgi:hypothetical protein